MTAAFQNHAFTLVDSDTLTFTADMPSSISEGDLLLGGIGKDGAETIAGPAGWTEEAEGGPGDASLWVGWKKATASEPSTYDWTVSSDDRKWCGAVSRITGQHATTPVDVVSSVNSGTSTNPVAPDVTTTQDNVEIFRFWARDDDAGVTQDGGYPSGHTGIWSDFSGTAASCASAGAYKTQASAGSPGTATWTVSVSNGWAGVTIGIAPAAAGGPNLAAIAHYYRMQHAANS